MVNQKEKKKETTHREKNAERNILSIFNLKIIDIKDMTIHEEYTFISMCSIKFKSYNLLM